VHAEARCGGGLAIDVCIEDARLRPYVRDDAIGARAAGFEVTGERKAKVDAVLVHG
jgi:hypothetical protein